MENPWLFQVGFERGGHSPKQVALATRKVCQNHEILEGFAPGPAVDKDPTAPYLSAVV